MKILTEFGKKTTFHGISHAVAARSRSGKISWVLIFLVGSSVALWQSVTRLISYINDDSNVIKQDREVLPEQLAEVHYFKVCPTHWIDRQKALKAVLDGRLTYRNILFALSLLPSVNGHLLRDMGNWKEINKVDRIWGIPRCTTELFLSLKRKKRGLAIGFRKLSKLIRKPKYTNISITTNGTNKFPKAVTLSSKGGRKTFEKNINVLIIPKRVSPVKAFTDGRVSGKNVPHRLSMDVDCGPVPFMKDWMEEARSFNNVSSATYSTLTHFFSSIANDFNPLENFGGRHVRWEITGSGLCQVTELSKVNLSAANGRVKDLEVSVESVESRIDRLEVDIVPFAMESTYTKNILTTDHDKVGPNFDQGALGASFLRNHFVGSNTRLTFNLPYIGRLDRKIKCATWDGQGRLADGYASFRCKATCRKQNEYAEGIDGYRVITENDAGDIPLNLKLAPNRYVDVVVDLEKAAKCMDMKGCGLRHFCQEWKIESSILVEEDVYIMKSPFDKSGGGRGTYDTSAPKEIRMIFVMNLGQGHEIRYGRRLGEIDMLGIIGGILGLYLGCSILTTVHCLTFFVAKLYGHCRGDKVDFVRGGGRMA